MAQPGFFNSNEGRAFPFLYLTTNQSISGQLHLGNLPDPIIVDCGFLLSPQTQFDPAAHSVYLESITRIGGEFVFSFGSDCPGLAGVPLEFVRTWPAARYLTEFSDSGTDYADESVSGSFIGSLAVLGTHCDEPLWSGYLVTGDLSALDTFLSGNGTVSRENNDTTVEPALIQHLGGALVTALAVANADRTRVTGTGGCEGPSWPYPIGSIFTNTICLNGLVLFSAGYNAVVQQTTQDNSITLGAVVGAGHGQPCTELALFGGETAPEGSTLLEGGLRCNETVRAINGIGGPILRIMAGSGVTLTPDPDTNTLHISVDMIGLISCFTASSSISEEL